MTQAQLNILINVRAKQARDALNKLTGALRRLEGAVLLADTGLSTLVAKMSNLATPASMASASLSNLSKSLAAIGRSKAAKTLDTIGVNAAQAAASLLEMAVAAEMLEAKLISLNAVANGTAASLRSLSAANAALMGLGAAGTAAGAGATAAAAGTAAAGTAAAATAKKTSSAGKELVKYTDNVRRGSKEIDLFRDSAGNSIRNVTDSTYRLNNSSKEYINTTGSAARTTSFWGDNLSATGAKMTKFGSQMQWAGRQMALYFTAPMALAIGMGVKWQLDLEKQQTNLKKVYDAGLGDSINDANSKTAAQFRILTDELRKLSDATGTSQEEITEMAAAWAQAGKSGQELLEFTKLTNQAMIVGDMTAEKSSEGMQALALQWGFTGKKSAEGISEIQGALQKFNLASNITQVSMEDLFDGMSRTGAQARDAGLSFDETTAILTALTRVTGTAATAGNGLKSISTNLRASSNSMPEVVEKVSLITNGLLDMDSAAYQSLSTMDKFRHISNISKKLNTQQLAELNFALFGKYQSSRGAQINKDLQDWAGNIVKVQEALESGTGKNSRSFKQWQEELRTYFESNPQKFKIASTAIKNSLMDIGVIALPYILSILQTIAKLAKAFTNLPEGVQQAALAFGVFIALAAPIAVLLGATNVLIGSMAKTLAWFGKTFTKAGRASKKGGADIGAAGATTAKSGNIITRTAAKVRKAVIGGIAAPFKAAAAAVKTGSAQTAAAAKAGSRATSSAWAAGMGGIPSSTAAAGNTAAAVHAANGRRMLNSTLGMTNAEVAAYHRRGMLTAQAIASATPAQLAAIKASGAAQTAQTQANVASQVAATRTGAQAQLVAARSTNAAEIMQQQAHWAAKMGAQSRAQAASLASLLAHQKQILALNQRFAAGELGQRRVAEAQKKVIETTAAINRLNAQSMMYAKMVATARTSEAAMTAATVSGNKARVAATAAGARGQAGAAAAGGAAAAAGAKNGAKRGMRGGGIAGIILTSLLFIPPGMFKSWGTKIKNYFTTEGKGFQKILERLGMNSMKGFARGLSKILVRGGPIAAAFGVAAALVGNAMDEIKKIVADIRGDKNIPMLAKPFVAIVRGIGAALGKLPKLVADVFNAVVRTIAKAAKAVYNFFSYINPFARHSPSLVENVQNGMAVVTGEFADASKKIQTDIRSAYGAISQFGRATSNLKVRATTIETEDRNKELNRADPSGGAARSYAALDAQAKRLESTMLSLNATALRQQRIIDGLENQVKQADAAIEGMQKGLDLLQKAADATGKALDAAKEKLDYYASAPIKGMRAMSDAIFENEMAQKRLRLEILKLEDAGESIDSLEDKFARLQGQIETLSGTRMELQSKGAGSDVLATYDKMIADLKSQQNAQLEGPSTEIEKLNKQLDELGRKGELLDLENSLKFDPLTRQIEQLVNNEKELDFSTIVAGVTTYKSAVSGLTIANDFATAAVEAQQLAIDAATESRDALNSRLDIEKDKLDQVKSAYDATSTAVDDTRAAMDEITQAASVVNGRLDEIEQAQKEAADAAKEHEAALDAAGEALGDMADIDTELPEVDSAALEDSLGNLFPDVSKKLEEFGTKIKNWFKGLPQKIVDELRELGPKIGNFLMGLPGEIAGALAFLLGYIIGLIGRGIVESTKLMLGGLKLFFYDIPKNIGEWLAGIDWESVRTNVVNFIKGLFTGESWAKAGEWLLDVGGDIIGGLFKGIGNVLLNVTTWIKENIVDRFINGIKEGFEIQSPSKVMARIGVDIILGLLDGIVEKAKDLWNWITGLAGMVREKLGNARDFLWQKGKDIIQGLKDAAVEKWNEFLDWVKGLPGQIKDKLGNLKNTLFEAGKDLIRGLIDGAGDLLKNIAQMFADKIPNKIIREGFKRAMGIASPSKVFAEFGTNIGEGLVIGMENQLADITSASNALSDAASAGINNAAPLSLPAVQAAPAALPAAPAAPEAGAAPAAAGPDPAALAAQVTAATQAATLVWQGYYANLTVMQTEHNALELVAQNTHDLAKMAALVAYNAAELTTVTSQYTALLTAQQTYYTTFTGLSTTFRTTEINAQIAWYASQITEFNKFSANYQSALTTLLNASKDLFDTFRIDVTDIFQNLATSMQDTVNGPITDVFTSLAGMLDEAVTNFQTAVTNIQSAWLGIQEGTAAPVRFTIDRVYNNGLMGVWNNVAELIGANKMQQYPVNFATGGPVKGPGTETSDSIPARLSRNEYVLSADAVRRAGGVTNLNRFNFGKSTPQGMFGIGGNYKVQSTNGTVMKLATGGPTDPGSPTWKAFQRGHLFAKRISPGPYILGGSSGGSRNGGTDCSGFLSEVADVIMGGPGGSRKWATGSFPGGGGAQGNIVRIGNQIWAKGLGAGHSIGISVPHAAGTLSGIPGLPNVNIESGGGTGGGATYGGVAVGANHPQFPTRYHLAITDGMFVAATAGGGASMMEILGSMVEPGLKKMIEDAKAFQGKGYAGTVPLKTAEAWDKGTRKKIEDEAKKLDAMGPGLGGGDISGVERWRPMVIAALKKQGFAGTKREQDAMLGQIWDESKGDPNAVNNWDINAQNGTPSRGLLQTIPSTFETWRDPSIPGGITDPWANMNAALRYYRDNYGNDLTTRWGRGKGGYDKGGWLPPTPDGFSTYYNHTGKPEAVLENSDWKAIYTAASKPAITPEIISTGFISAMKTLFGANTDQKIQDATAIATEVALEGENKKWNPLIIGAAEETAKAAATTTSAVTASGSKVAGAVDANSLISADQTKILTSMLGVLRAAQSAVPTVKYTPGSTDKETGKVTPENFEISNFTFSMFAPLIEAMGGLIENLPDAEPTYVDWAGTNRPVTDQMRQEKRLNDMANASKGMYMAFKTVAPSVLKHTAKIGSAIETLIAQDGAAWTAAIAGIAAGNPMAIAAAVALAFKAVFTLLPLILEAIVEIVPAIFKAIKMFITRFSPDSVYSYDSYDAANQAVNDNIDAIRKGASGPNFKVPEETIQNNTNQTTVLNIYGDISLPNVTNTSGAQNLANNLESLAG
ncbi:tape measure protein [Gordonia phage RobinSparkles]|nr:tape measure protein [Gordonia phage RobinSparkles]